MAKAAVAHASASARLGPTTVTLARPVAAWPVSGFTMCAPRSAVPDVATPQSLASTITARRPRLSGSAMPTRHGGADAGPAAAAPRGGGAGGGGVARAAARGLRAAPAVDQVAGRPGGGQDARGALDRPALHVAGRVEPAPRRRREVAAGQLADERARLDPPGQLGGAGVDRPLAAGEPRHVAVRAEG